MYLIFRKRTLYSIQHEKKNNVFNFKGNKKEREDYKLVSFINKNGLDCSVCVVHTHT